MDNNRLDFQDPKTREELYKKYIPLMFKIVNQHVGSLPLTFDDILGAAEEGFVKALNTFKEGTSQSFQQYAAWCMRNNILTSANEEGHVVKFNAYQQKKAKERGESTFITHSINNYYDEEDSSEDKIAILGSEDPLYEPIPEKEVFSNLFEWIDHEFSQRDAEIFYKYFGINGREKMKGVDIAKEIGVSAATVTVTNKKIIKRIKMNESLLEQLSTLI